MQAIFIGGPKHGDVELIGHAPSRLPAGEASGAPVIYKKGPTFARGAEGIPTDVWYIIDGMALEEARQQVKTINLSRTG